MQRARVIVLAGTLGAVARIHTRSSLNRDRLAVCNPPVHGRLSTPILNDVVPPQPHSPMPRASRVPSSRAETALANGTSASLPSGPGSPLSGAGAQEDALPSIHLSSRPSVLLVGGTLNQTKMMHRIAGALGGSAAITTAGDLALGTALPPPCWRQGPRFLRVSCALRG